MTHKSKTDLLVLQTLRVKGFIDTALIAENVSLNDEETLEILNVFEEKQLARYRDGRMSGWMLTPEGRSAGEVLLADEVDSLGIRKEIEEAYRNFLEVNGGFLTLCTDWQLIPALADSENESKINEHTDSDYDSIVIQRLVDMDDGAQPICSSLAKNLGRFSTYSERFTFALEKVLAGEIDWFTKPMIESYHTVWFELHENLLSTLGIDRATES